jgi:hypothetical protein
MNHAYFEAFWRSDDLRVTGFLVCAGMTAFAAATVACADDVIDDTDACTALLSACFACANAGDCTLELDRDFTSAALFVDVDVLLPLLGRMSSLEPMYEIVTKYIELSLMCKGR